MYDDRAGAYRPGQLDAERRRFLEISWRRERYREAGQDRDVHSLRTDAAELERRLARAARKLADLTA